MSDDEIVSVKHQNDYYAFLNVSRSASVEDIRNAYRLLSRQFHPDKHTNPALKKQAELMFNKLKKIYDVLSDPDKRAIYDTLGASGLENEEWALVQKRFKSSKEIKEEYEQMLKDKRERIMQQRTNPKGTITVLVDATELFERSDEDDEESEYSFFLPSSVEVRSMTISQAIEAPLNSDNNLLLNGSISVRNGIGSGTISAGLRHIFSPSTWSEIEFGAGQGPVLTLKGFRTLTPNLHASCQTYFHLTSFGISPGLNFVVTRQLSKNFIGYLSYKTGSDSAMSTVAVYENEFCRINSSVQFGIRNSFLSSSYTHKFRSNNSRLKIGFKYGVLGTVLDYGYETRLSQYSTVGAALTVGSSSGVNLRLRLLRNNQNYVLPIILSEEILGGSVFYGTVLPLVSYYFVKYFIIDPYLKRKEKEEITKVNEANIEMLQQKKKEAISYIDLMKDFHDRIVDREHTANGLIIEKALYGEESAIYEYEHSSRPIFDSEESRCFDFKVALQVLVNENSRLVLADGISKSNLPGFYEPFISGTKKLLVLYRFSGKNYRALLDETEGITLPSERHLIS